MARNPIANPIIASPADDGNCSKNGGSPVFKGSTVPATRFFMHPFLLGYASLNRLSYWLCMLLQLAGVVDSELFQSFESLR